MAQADQGFPRSVVGVVTAGLRSSNTPTIRRVDLRQISHLTCKANDKVLTTCILRIVMDCSENNRCLIVATDIFIQ